MAEGLPEFADQPARSGCDEEEVVTLLDVQSFYDLRKRPLSRRIEVLETFVGRGFLGKDGENYVPTNWAHCYSPNGWAISRLWGARGCG